MDAKPVKLASELETRTLPIDRILPTKQVSASTRQGTTYAAILASIKEVGIVEPPVVYPLKGKPGKRKQYLLLDGHLRVEILQGLGHTEVRCLIATDEDPFNYNHKTNRIAPIQEHFMILRAIGQGRGQKGRFRFLSPTKTSTVAQGRPSFWPRPTYYRGVRANR